LLCATNSLTKVLLSIKFDWTSCTRMYFDRKRGMSFARSEPERILDTNFGIYDFR